MPNFENSQVNEIKNRIDIVEVVRENVPNLKPVGSNWKGLCPFHNERTPSFIVSPDKQIWHCFGCNEGGDVFTFLMKLHGYEFPDALRWLADKAGITLDRFDPEKNSLRNKLLDMHIAAGVIYVNNLFSAPGDFARNYLKKRGLNKELVNELGLGLSSARWNEVYQSFTTKGFSNREILASGLVLQNNQGKYFDRFRERLMFPLKDTSGQVIGYAGRILVDKADQAKYVNSPQTALYNKSNFLYGLNLAKQSIRSSDAVIIVEGYFDWLALYRAGITNVVAVSGTALTNDHLDYLQRYTKNIIFALDADEAGERALERSVLMTLSHELTPYVLVYDLYDAKHFKDPDELTNYRAEAWVELLTKKILALDYYLGKLFNQIGGDDLVGQKQALARYLPFLKMASSAIDREHFLKKLSAKTGLSISSLVMEMENLSLTNAGAYSHRTGSGDQKEPHESYLTSPLVIRAWRWLALLVRNPQYIDEINERISAKKILEPTIREIFEKLQIYVASHEGANFDYKDFKSTISHADKLDNWLLQAEDIYTDFSVEEIKAEIILLTAKLKEDYYKYELNKVSHEIAQAEEEKNQSKLKGLLQRYSSLADELAHLFTK